MVNGLPRTKKQGAASTPKETFVEEFDMADDDLAFE